MARHLPARPAGRDGRDPDVQNPGPVNGIPKGPLPGFTRADAQHPTFTGKLFPDWSEVTCSLGDVWWGMSHLEKAVVRHIARTAFQQTLEKHGEDAAILEVRRQVSLFIADMGDESTKIKLRMDLEEIIQELQGNAPGLTSSGVASVRR